MNVIVNGANRMGQSFTDTVMTVVVHDGRRGKQGFKGDEGDQGPPGDSIDVLGTWQMGQVYAPGDAVTWRSSAVQGVNSLYIQLDSWPEEASTVEPQDDPSRWTEVGATDLSNVTGSVWNIMQLNHGFTQVGTPVAFSYQSSTWVKADRTLADNVAIAVVREVLSADRAVLQSTGEITNLDPAIITPNGSSWQLGRQYYVSNSPGRVQLDVPTDGVVHAILVPTDNHEAGGAQTGVVLPWKPDQAVRRDVLVGQKKFYFTAGAGQTVFTGPDMQGNTLDYVVGPNTDVFVQGLNQSEITDYTATDGTSVVLTVGAQAGDMVEIWTPDQPLTVVVPAAAIKVDAIEGQFDGVKTDFVLLDTGAPIAVVGAPSVSLWLDGCAQEPLVDFNILVDPLEPTGSIVSFPEPPLAGTSFWAIIGRPI
jgi:hypothetical protein